MIDLDARPDPHINVEDTVDELRRQGATEDDVYRWHARWYSFARLTPAVLDRLVALSPLLDMGAGNGYWAWRLRQLGADVIAMDPGRPTDVQVEPDMPPLRPANPAVGVFPWGHERAGAHPERALLMVWPSTFAPWPLDAIDGYTAAGGRTVAIVSDAAYRHCGRPDIPPRLVNLGFRRWEAAIPVCSWSWIADELQVWAR